MDINTRELILDILLQIDMRCRTEPCGYWQHIGEVPVFAEVYPAISRICEGTLEYRAAADCIINRFSSVPVRKMKPLIRI